MLETMTLAPRTLNLGRFSGLWALTSLLACGPSSEVSGALTAVAADLPRYRIEAGQLSASGLSSGAFMAVQFHLAYSSSMVGAAVFAGGPYYCAQGSIVNATTGCMSTSSAPAIAPLLDATRRFAARGDIDPVAGLDAQRVYLFGGASDRTVNPPVMDALADYYGALIGRGSIVYERRRPGTAHTMPTTSYGIACDQTASPYVGRCGFDGAGRALEQIYGPLSPPASGPLSGEIITIAQGDFVANPSAHSLADEAFAYVPRSCAEGEPCRVHVAFHGCLQSAEAVGDAYYLHAGYNEWADTNRIIVLYPQTVRGSGNPNACWDWWGYDSADYATRRGPQLAMVKAMVDRLAAGVGVPRPDAGVIEADAGATELDAGAAEADASAAEADAGHSAPDASTSDSGEAPLGACLRATNAEHVAQGRAHAALGIAYANGSNQPLGVNNTWVWSALRSTGPNTYVISYCY